MPIITLSRGSLSGGELLAKQLASKLGFKVFSREVIVDAARAYGVSERQLQEQTDKPPGIWARLTHQQDRYIKAMRAALGELIAGDDVVYHGHAGRFLLQGLSPVINLRLIAPLEYRLRSSVIEHNLSQGEAQDYIAALDEQRARWVRRMYGADWADPALYNLVINLEHMSIETATEVVAAIAAKPEYARTPRSDQELRDFALKSRIVAELTFRSSLPAEIVEVEVRTGVVELRGKEAFERKRDQVLAFVKTIRGVETLALDGAAAAAGETGAPAQEETAADVMLPITSYPRVPHWLSIREAIAALTASSIQLRDGHEILPRYVLVTDEQDRLVGIIGRRDLLKGLSIQLKTMEQMQRDLRSVTSAPDLSNTISFRWISFFNRAASERAQEPVKSIMAPIIGTARPEHGLSHVVATMIRIGIDLLPVMDGDRALGVVLMTDVFDRVAQHILEYGPEAASLAAT